MQDVILFACASQCSHNITQLPNTNQMKAKQFVALHNGRLESSVLAWIDENHPNEINILLAHKPCIFVNFEPCLYENKTMPMNGIK